MHIQSFRPRCDKLALSFFCPCQRYTNWGDLFHYSVNGTKRSVFCWFLKTSWKIQKIFPQFQEVSLLTQEIPCRSRAARRAYARRHTYHDNPQETLTRGETRDFLISPKPARGLLIQGRLFYVRWRWQLSTILKFQFLGTQKLTSPHISTANCYPLRCRRSLPVVVPADYSFHAMLKTKRNIIVVLRININTSRATDCCSRSLIIIIGQF